MRLVYSPLAQADIKQLTIYGITEFGEDQSQRYLDGLSYTLQMLLDHPYIGAVYPRDAQYRRFTYHRHIIFYRIEKAALIVERVLSGSADVDRYIL